MARTDERFRTIYNALLDRCETLGSEAHLPTETALANDLDVSRTVVRAALQRLNDNSIIAWRGRDKVILREPAKEDRLQVGSATPTADELESRFFDWVLRFDVPPGTPLNVTKLAREFAVPPYMLQEFLASLGRFGLVERRPRGGWILLGFTPEFAVELSDFRMMLELNAVSQFLRLPADHRLWHALEVLEADHLALAAEIDSRYHDFSRLDETFHSALGSVVKNRFVAEFQKVISLIFHYHYQWDKKSERRRNEAAIREHLAVISALLARDEPAALEAARRHLATSKQTLLTSLRVNDLA